MSARQPMPFAVRVLGMEIPVLVRDQERDNYLDGKHAYCDHPRERIVLNANQEERQRQDALWHELFHCCEKATGTYVDEEVVLRIGRAQFAILRDNPALVAWLMEGA